MYIWLSIGKSILLQCHWNYAGENIQFFVKNYQHFQKFLTKFKCADLCFFRGLAVQMKLTIKMMIVCVCVCVCVHICNKLNIWQVTCWSVHFYRVVDSLQGFLSMYLIHFFHVFSSHRQGLLHLPSRATGLSCYSGTFISGALRWCEDHKTGRRSLPGILSHACFQFSMIYLLSHIF